MNKVEFENFYKFLVSIGLVLLALPFVLLNFLLKENSVLCITTADLASYSSIAQSAILAKQRFTNFSMAIIPYALLVMFLVGIAFLVVGSVLWLNRTQKQQDEKQSLENEKLKKELGLTDMTPAEIAKKAVNKQRAAALPSFSLQSLRDVLPAGGISTLVGREGGGGGGEAIDFGASSVDLAKMDWSAVLSQPADAAEKYLEIEELVLRSLAKQYQKQYAIQQNVSLHGAQYDALLISATLPCVLVEIQYKTNLSLSEIVEGVGQSAAQRTAFERQTGKSAKAALLYVVEDAAFKIIEAEHPDFFDQGAQQVALRIVGEESLKTGKCGNLLGL